MRHFMLPGAVSTLAFGMGTTAAMRVLVATAGSPQRLLTCLRRTSSAAVAVAAITVAAHEHGGAATGAQVASSRKVHWQSGPMDCGHKRALREILCRQRRPRQGASGRGIGSDLVVGTGVAPAFPPAGPLSTASATSALLSRRPGGLVVRPLQLTLNTVPGDPSRPIPAALRLPDNDCCAIRPPEALRAAKRKTGIFMPEIQKPKPHPACAVRNPENPLPPGSCGN